MPFAIWSGLIASLAPRGVAGADVDHGIGRRLASRTGIFLPNVRPLVPADEDWWIDDC